MPDVREEKLPPVQGNADLFKAILHPGEWPRSATQEMLKHFARFYFMNRWSCHRTSARAKNKFARASINLIISMIFSVSLHLFIEPLSCGKSKVKGVGQENLSYVVNESCWTEIWQSYTELKPGF